MNFSLDEKIAVGYKSKSQKIRVMSEDWVAKNVYCPCCGNLHIKNLENNKPVSDFQCDNCGAVFELKSKEGNIGRKIADGAYSIMIERITSITNPELLLMQYSKDYTVFSLTLIPKFFFVPDIIEKRKPLSPNAKRAGWIGCNIIYSDIPDQGKIKILENHQLKNIDSIVNKYKHIKQLQINSIESRGWLIDVLNCVNSIPKRDFSLNDVYKFSDELQKKHIDNHNVQAKIRQQLQILRDKNFIEFVERGYYRKLY